MTELIFKVLNHFSYTFKKKGLHSLHSPYVYDFAANVLFDRKHYPAYENIKRARHMMLRNRNLIETVDFGAESGNNEFKTYRIRVNKLAKKRIGRMKDLELLYRMVGYFRPESILELGTSTGMSSVALASADKNIRLTTIEGCASVASVAQSVFDKLGLHNIDIEIGNFNSILPGVLNKLPKLDMVFFDGNHRRLATLNYFHQCMAKAHHGSIFIFDDIRWSAEMYEAWLEIVSTKEVSLSIELSRMGIVFFRHAIEKQHFVLG